MNKKQIKNWRRYTMFVLVGIFVGFVVIHPLAMLISQCHHSELNFNWKGVGLAFSADHFPMAVFLC